MDGVWKKDFFFFILYLYYIFFIKFYFQFISILNNKKTCLLCFFSFIFSFSCYFFSFLSFSIKSDITNILRNLTIIKKKSERKKKKTYAMLLARPFNFKLGFSHFYQPILIFPKTNLFTNLSFQLYIVSVLKACAQTHTYIFPCSKQMNLLVSTLPS